MSKAFGSIIGIPIIGAVVLADVLIPRPWSDVAAVAITISYMVWFWRLPNGPR